MNLAKASDNTACQGCASVYLSLCLPISSATPVCAKPRRDDRLASDQVS